MILGMIGFTNAIDYDNISFTNEEFFNGAVTATKVLELSNGKIAVGYLTASTANLKICDLDGTNCGSPVSLTLSSPVSLDLLDDGTNIHLLVGYGSRGREFVYNYSLSFQYNQDFNVGSTNYVSAVQTNSTDFVIAYQDTADSSKAKLIKCKLDGSSCGSEINLGAVVNYNKLILASDGKLKWALQQDGVNGGLFQRNADLSGSFSFLGNFNSGATSYIDMIEGSDNKLKIMFIVEDAGSDKQYFNSCELDGTNCVGNTLILEDWDAGGSGQGNILEANGRLFQAYRSSTLGYPQIINFNLTGGNISTPTQFYDTGFGNAINSIYTSNNQIILSFQDSTNSKGMFAISEQFTSASGITFNNPTQNQYLNSTSFLLNVSFTQITNSTYKLNGGLETTLGTNENESTANLTGIEGLNTLTVFTNTSGDLSNSSINFTIDTINPIITNNIPLESNSYSFNGSWFSCSDTNIYLCYVEINGFNQSSGSDFTLNNNGNLNYVITAIDLGGNTVTDSGVLFVNPYQYFYFEETDTTPITNFDFGGQTFTNYAQFLTYDLGLGTSSLTFEKVGYQTQTFNITLTNTSNINTTYTISNAKIIINMLRKNDSTVISGETFTVEFIATVGATDSTSTGELIVENTFFQPENYVVTITSANYLTEQLFFYFNNQEVLEIDAYFIEKNSTEVGTVFIKVTDLGGSPVKSANVYAEQWDASTSSFKSVSQGITGEDGLASVSVILNDKNYKFSASSGDRTGESVIEIIDTTENGKTIVIPLDSDLAVQNYLFKKLDYTITDSFNNATNISTISVSWSNLDGLNQELCINRYRTLANSEKLQESNCDTAVSGELIQAYFINSSLDVSVKVEVKYNNAYFTLKTFQFEPNTSPSNLLLDTNLAPFVIPILFILSIALGLYIENLYIGTFLLTLSTGVSLLLVPTLTNGGITAFFFFLGYLIINGGVRSR